MTPPKTATTAPVRPSIEECIEAWFLCRGGFGPSKAYKLGLATGEPPSNGPTSYQLYLRGIVEKALKPLVDVGYGPTFEGLLMHLMKTGSLKGYKLLFVISTPPREHREGTTDYKSDVDLHGFLEESYRSLRRRIRRVIETEPPFVGAAAAAESA